MTQHIRFYTLVIVFALVLSACSMSSTPVPASPGDEQAVIPIPTPTAVLTLQLIVEPAQSVEYNAVDMIIVFNYKITNTGSSPFPGPISVTVADGKVVPNCQQVTEIGDLDNNLDQNETLTCNGNYVITQGDLNTGSVTTISTASAGGSFSSPISSTVNLVQKRELKLSKTADPEPYESVDEVVVFSYRITNSGNVKAGPTQFTITLDKIGSPRNCGSPDTRLPPGGMVDCSVSYSITQADIDSGSVTGNATATDGTITSNSVSSTINKKGLAKGSNQSHEVIDGEWLWQIARCYGADPKQVISDNPISDFTKLKPGTMVTVRDIGSEGAIYGPPCVHRYTVKAGDTWASITNDFNNRNIDVDIRLLQEANPGGLVPGDDIKVPVGPYQFQ